jgi:hypothetical protein
MIRAAMGVVTDGSYRPGYCLNSFYHNAVFAFVRFRVISCVTYDPGSWSPRNPDHTYSSKPIYISLSGGERASGWGSHLVAVAAGRLENPFLGCGRPAAGLRRGLWLLRPAGNLRRRAAAVGLRLRGFGGRALAAGLWRQGFGGRALATGLWRLGLAAGFGGGLWWRGYDGVLGLM